MATAEKRPNVVVNTTSESSGDWIRWNGNATTPFIDSLAEESIGFQAITPHPMGVFARQLLTGALSRKRGRRLFRSTPESAVTIAHRFQEGGYNTAFFGNGNCTNAIECSARRHWAYED